MRIFTVGTDQMDKAARRHRHPLLPAAPAEDLRGPPSYKNGEGEGPEGTQGETASPARAQEDGRAGGVSSDVETCGFPAGRGCVVPTGRDRGTRASTSRASPRVGGPFVVMEMVWSLGGVGPRGPGPTRGLVGIVELESDPVERRSPERLRPPWGAAGASAGSAKDWGGGGGHGSCGCRSSGDVGR